MLGCDVVATDQAEVLPLLRRNVERNTSRILQTNRGLHLLRKLSGVWNSLFLFSQSSSFLWSRDQSVLVPIELLWLVISRVFF